MATITPHITVSEILRSKDESEDGPKKKSREDWRKAKELEEARKAGTAPAAVDEEGKDINPHIPQYISSAPWYFNAAGPTLKHQRIQPETIKTFARLDEWYKRGVDATKVATKYRKGACENCGAMTHKKKDCLERPRKVQAKFNNANIAPDEFVQPTLSRDFDGKRDRWAGYDPAQHKEVVERFAKIEEAKRQIRSEKLNAQAQAQGEGEEDGDKEDEESNDEDDDKYADEIDMPGTKVDSKQRITVRNLRIREDTAKYLRNLDPNSAYYDPKTRSMRDNPYAGTSDEVDYAGENFVRFTGDTQQHGKMQMFAWEAYEKGVDVHPLGEPTKLEMLGKEFDSKKDQFKKKGQLSVLEKYGGEEHLEAPPKELLLAQTEHYAEYTRYGTIVKGEEKMVIRSRYEEDVYTNNHTSVWGSYWSNGQWAYKCCHSFVKGSYCTGEAGKAAAMNEFIVPKGPVRQPSPTPSSTPGTTSGATVSSDSTTISTSATTPASANAPSTYAADIGLRETVVEKEPESSSESSDSSNDSSSESEDEEAKAARKKKKNQKKKAQKKKRREEKKRKKKEKKKKKQEKADEKLKDTLLQLKEALKKEEERQKEGERLLAMDDRKRPYNSMAKIEEPTELEMEAYYMKKRRDEDPMAQFM